LLIFQVILCNSILYFSFLVSSRNLILTLILLEALYPFDPLIHAHFKNYLSYQTKIIVLILEI